MSSLRADNVYQGFWIDYSKGNVLGATITLNNVAATVLVAFVAGIISLTGCHIWNIVALFYFLARASDKLHDGYYQQQQVIMRNISTPIGFMIQSLKETWYWRKRAQKRHLICSIFSVAVAAVCSLGSIAAGVYSAKMISSSDIDVLVKSSYCGNWNLSDIGFTSPFLAWQDDLLSQSLQFATSCYNSSIADPSCQVFTKTNVLYDITRVSCPFPSACLGSTDTPAIQLDTGLLDSNVVFGVNAQQKDRIQFRKRTTCGPIDANRYLTISDDPKVLEGALGNALPGEEAYLYSFGPTTEGLQLDANSTVGLSTYTSNRTYEIDITEASFYPQSGSNEFMPIPQFLRSDADTVLLFVMLNAVYILSPCNDIIFSAHRKKQAITFGGSVTVFTADNPAGLIGCTEQYQMCGSYNCTSLTASAVAQNEAQYLGLNDQQNTTSNQFWNLPVNYDFDISIIAEMTPAPLLLSIPIGYHGNIPSLPDNQWEIEVQGWFNFILSLYQWTLADYAKGPATDSMAFLNSTLGPSTSSEQQLCQSQRLKAPNGFSNISIFGLSFTWAVCFFIVPLDIFLPNILRWVARYNKKLSSKMKLWKQDGFLYLQKSAYEAMGTGNWEKDSREIPIAAKEDLFANLSSPFLGESTATKDQDLEDSGLERDDAEKHPNDSDQNSLLDRRTKMPIQVDHEEIATPPDNYTDRSSTCPSHCHSDGPSNHSSDNPVDDSLTYSRVCSSCCLMKSANEVSASILSLNIWRTH